MTPNEIRQLMRGTDWNAMFESDSPFENKTFRRKQDRRLYPSALEFGLKHGFSMAAGLNSGQQVSFLLDRVTLPYWDLQSFDQLPTPGRMRRGRCARPAAQSSSRSWARSSRVPASAATGTAGCTWRSAG